MTQFPYPKLFALAVTASMLFSACNAEKPIATVDLQAQITQTMQAVATDAQATLLAAVPTAAPATSTPPPTATPAPTATSAPAQPPAETPALVATEPPAAIFTTALKINEATNCRTGPSANYTLVFTAEKDATLKIVSNTSVSEYVIVENPSTPGQTCWLWTKYSTVSGNLASLPVVTPPVLPTPELGYSLAYYRIETCNDWSIAFKITNLGAKTLNSYKIVAEDLTEKTQQTTISNDFDRRNGCVVEESISSLDTGESGYIYAHDFTFDPKGDSMRATVTVCTHNDLASDCWIQVAVFTP